MCHFEATADSGYNFEDVYSVQYIHYVIENTCALGQEN